jgi:CubicO group peptidase (beta-lactamase class C family)
LLVVADNEAAMIKQILSFCVVSFLCLSTYAAEKRKPDIAAISPERAISLNQAFNALIKTYNINTLGVAVIKQQQIVWQNYYGWQSPGVPASANTLFNVASLTKTVSAEAILRLVADGKLSLDEPMSDYWLDPDIAKDKRHRDVTARMALSHTSGFMNWRFFSADNKLKLINAPGTTFNYSGEGYQYLMKYAENKLGGSFEELVRAYVFDPVGMKDVSLSAHNVYTPRIAKPMDYNGKFYGYYCYPQGYCRKEGEYSAAGNMLVSVPDYAKFLLSSMRGDGLNAALIKQRNTMQSVEIDKEHMDCRATPQALCPTEVGYGLGWGISQLENDKLIGHRGSDWSVVSLAYYYQHSGDGLVIFFNAPNAEGIAGMVDALQLLDPDSPEIHGYKMRRARVKKG